MKTLYYFMLAGLIASFIAITAGAVAMLFPSGIAPDNTVVAIPTDVKAGTLVKYKINGCEEGKFRGVTSVNIQTTDTPPSITVAVAAPSAQAIHCQNVILIPAPVPTGDYKVLVFITYNTNAVKDLLNPERRQYTSNTIHITNDNPLYKLPESLSPNPVRSETQSAESTPRAETSSNQPVPANNPKQTEPAPQPVQPKQNTVDTVLNTIDNVVNSLLGVKG